MCGADSVADGKPMDTTAYVFLAGDVQGRHTSCVYLWLGGLSYVQVMWQNEFSSKTGFKKFF